MPSSSTHLLKSLGVMALVLLAYTGGILHTKWAGHEWPLSLIHLPQYQEASGSPSTDAHDHSHSEEPDHEHSETGNHDIHDAHEHGENADLLWLSESARKNLGLTEDQLKPIELQSYQRTVTVPAVVADRPGRTRLPVSAAMTGIVTHVHAVAGEAIAPGELILEMRLTHEDLVTAQKEFLQALGDLDIEQKEIARIEGLAANGSISSKSLLERQYSRYKLESLLRTQRESLRLHGLMASQISLIEKERRLLTEIKIVAPTPDDHSHEELLLGRSHGHRDANVLAMNNETQAITLAADERLRTVSLTRAAHEEHKDDHGNGHAELDKKSATHSDEHDRAPDHPSVDSTSNLLILQDLNVQKGQIVEAGALLCTLADYSQLLIEGQAFETEASLIVNAQQKKWKVSAIVENNGLAQRIDNLDFGWIDNEIQPASRVLKFYVGLPNELLQTEHGSLGQRHVTWRYRVGQRLQILIPVEQWTDQIVLPADAVVKEGPGSFVFQQNGDGFQRLAVHERYRDQTSVVIMNDGTIYPGDVIARKGAHQMQMALKNKTTGGVDPHAGHNH